MKIGFALKNKKLKFNLQQNTQITDLTQSLIEYDIFAIFNEDINI